MKSQVKKATKSTRSRIKATDPINGGKVYTHATPFTKMLEDAIDSAYEMGRLAERIETTDGESQKIRDAEITEHQRIAEDLVALLEGVGGSEQEHSALVRAHNRTVQADQYSDSDDDYICEDCIEDMRQQQQQQSHHLKLVH